MQDECLAAFSCFAQLSVEVLLFPACKDAGLLVGESRLHREVGLWQENRVFIIGLFGHLGRCKGEAAERLAGIAPHITTKHGVSAVQKMQAGFIMARRGDASLSAPGGDTSVILEFVKEGLDPIAGFAEKGRASRRVFEVWPGRDIRPSAAFTHKPPGQLAPRALSASSICTSRMRSRRCRGPASEPFAGRGQTVCPAGRARRSRHGFCGKTSPGCVGYFDLDGFMGWPAPQRPARRRNMFRSMSRRRRQTTGMLRPSRKLRPDPRCAW